MNRTRRRKTRCFSQIWSRANGLSLALHTAPGVSFLGLAPLQFASAAALGLLAWSPSVAASPASEIASAFDKGDSFDLHTSVSYRYSSRNSVIKREFVGFPGTDPNGPTPIVRDLLFSSSKHEIIPKLELGLFHNFWLSAGLPVVLASSSTLSFDQRRTPCVFPGSGGMPTCINKDNSSTLGDGLLPANGFDARDPNGPGFTNPSSSTIFRGTDRRGLTTLNLGLGIAPMSQATDDTKPTWKLGAEVQLAVGSTKQLNRFKPERAKGVSDGVTNIKLWTSMAKSLGWAEPHFEMWWRAPLTVRQGAPLAPLRQNFGATSDSPQQQAGTRFGVEATVWDDTEDDLRIGFDFSTTLIANFEGRGYSDMWEVFAYAGVATEPDAPLVLDKEPTVSGVQSKSYPGPSNIENFMTLDTQLQLTAEAGKLMRFSAGFGMQFEQGHIISFANAGTDLPTCRGSVVANCETNNNVVVNPGTSEVNPLHAPTIDLAGHRYRVADGKTFVFSLNALFLF